MADRILTTQAGSLPRPTDLIELIWANMDGQQVDRTQLEDRMRSAVAEVVAKQRDLLQADPAVAWHKLAAMVQGAELASAELA